MSSVHYNTRINEIPGPQMKQIVALSCHSAVLVSYEHILLATMLMILMITVTISIFTKVSVHTK